MEHDVREQEQGQEAGAAVQGNIQLGGEEQRENVQAGRRLPGVGFVFGCLKNFYEVNRRLCLNL